MSLRELYILTDAEGFVTACGSGQEALLVESGRRPLTAPIMVVHWRLHRSAQDNGWAEWRRVETFPWRPYGS